MLAPRASTGALEACDPCTASPAFPLTAREANHMIAFIRSLCLAVLLAAGSAWAQQQQTDNPVNPHSTTAKDPQSTQYGQDRIGTNATADQGDHDMILKNATPE